jgi:uncharacterized protein involved in outer membrane biogenesis
VKKALMAAAAGLALLVLGGLAVAAYLVRRVDTPEFQKAVLERARATIGADVRVKKMEISVLEGVTLKGVTIGNPPGYRGDLMSAEAFVLRYRLWPLLRGRFEVQRLSLEKPAVTLAMDGRGVFNYERLGGASAPAVAPPPAGRPATRTTTTPFDLVLSRLSVDDANVAMLDERRATLMKAEDADFRSSFALTGGVLQGTGKASIATLDLADALFVRSVSAPLETSKDVVKLSPIKGRLAEGAVDGALDVDLKGFRYSLRLDVKGAQVKKLLEEAKSAQSASGKLQAKASFEGTGGLPTVKGQGQADVTDCRVEKSAVLALVAGLLRLPELVSPRFDTCHLEFTLGANKARVPALAFKGREIQLTGKGVTDLGTSSLDFDFTLALEKQLLDRIPVRELKGAFHERGDGFSAVDFKVTGTTQQPKTDLTTKIAAGTATEIVKGGIGKLFGKKKPQ